MIYALQLYSGRHFPPLDRQLESVARHGYSAVETFGPLHDDVAATRAALDRHGLSAPTVHFGLDVLEADAAGVIEKARVLGAEIIVAPYLPPDRRPADRAGWIALGERLARVRDGAAQAGFGFAWHNHDFEFATLPDGSVPLEHILGADLAWEADLAWVVRGGAAPADWIERYRGRIPIIHAKDIAPAGEKTDEDGWADVGQGVMPWGDLWRLGREAGARIMIAEHDNPADFDRFARVGAAAMRRFEEASRS